MVARVTSLLPGFILACRPASSLRCQGYSENISMFKNTFPYTEDRIRPRAKHVGWSTYQMGQARNAIYHFVGCRSSTRLARYCGRDPLLVHQDFNVVSILGHDSRNEWKRGPIEVGRFALARSTSALGVQALRRPIYLYN